MGQKNKFISEVDSYLRRNKSEWSTWKTAKLLGENKSTLIHQQINLTKELVNFPELEDSKTANIALNKLRKIKSGGIITEVQKEMDIQNLIYTHWPDIFKEWELVETRNNGKYNTNGIGEIDFLAKHLTEKGRYLVI